MSGEKDATREALRKVMEIWPVTIEDRDHWKDRADKAEATIARVITALEAAEKSVPDDWGVTYIYTSQLRAALEGGQQ